MLIKLKSILISKVDFFLEVGAYDGLFQSNTLFLEKDLNWKGILIERLTNFNTKENSTWDGVTNDYLFVKK